MSITIGAERLTLDQLRTLTTAHTPVVIVADGTPEAAKRLERVLWNDPATGVMRHADAGYDIAKDAAREHGLNLPSMEAAP